MKSLFDFDNSAFLEHLERKGFFVARRSTANYCQTPLCLSSSLNATYLDELVKGLGNDQTELSDLIGKNNVVASLRPAGLPVRHLRDRASTRPSIPRRTSTSRRTPISASFSGWSST